MMDAMLCTPSPLSKQLKIYYHSFWESRRQTALSGGTASGIALAEESSFP